MSEQPRLTLLCFKTGWCPACKASHPAVQSFLLRHTDVVLKEVEMEDSHEVPNETAVEMANAYGALETPTFVLEDSTFGEVARAAQGLNLKGLELLYEQAKERIAWKEKNRPA